MAEIIGGVFTSHVPAIGGAIARGLQQDPYWRPFFDGFPPVRQWLSEKKPHIAVVFYNDHGLNFFLDKMPTFAVGAAPFYDNADEGWGLPVCRSLEGAPDFSWRLIDSLVRADFDITMCQRMLVDHAVMIPFQLLWPDTVDWPVRVVPIAINTIQHPLPNPRRCLALGRAVGNAVQSCEDPVRVVMIGTGGLSHQLDGERAGFLNKDYDRFCLDRICDDPESLVGDSVLDIIEKSGSQGVEILNWIAARGAIGGRCIEKSRNYHIPISNTAAASLLLECA